jgi:hypothetical protein
LPIIEHEPKSSADAERRVTDARDALPEMFAAEGADRRLDERHVIGAKNVHCEPWIFVVEIHTDTQRRRLNTLFIRLMARVIPF